MIQTQLSMGYELGQTARKSRRFATDILVGHIKLHAELTRMVSARAESAAKSFGHALNRIRNRLDRWLTASVLAQGLSFKRLLTREDGCDCVETEHPPMKVARVQVIRIIVDARRF